MEHKGNPVSQGYAVGSVYLYSTESPSVEEGFIPAEAIEKTLEEWETARFRAGAELEALYDRLVAEGEDKASIFAAHLTLLNDVAIAEEIRAHIREERWALDWAIQRTFDKFVRRMQRSRNRMFQERAADFRDVGKRLLLASRGLSPQSLQSLPGPCILVTHELMPSDTANLDRKNVLGIVTEIGGDTSHSAIIARSLEIPAVLGVSGITECLEDGEVIVLDAVKGLVLETQEMHVLESYQAKATEYRRFLHELQVYKDVEPVTPDGTRVQVLQNLGSVSATDLRAVDYVDGVGLLRTEFLYMSSDHLPTEQEQFEAYRSVLSTFKEKPVTLRTLDIGGDKALPYFQMEKELNPFLGERAVRLCFRHPEMFRTQLRAALRASVYGNLWIMFPMIGTMEDIRGAKAALNQAREELRAEGIPFSEDIKIGVMIEIPSAGLLADLIAEEVDFASIGSNDLIQYTLAVDRMNQNVAAYYQDYSPAVLRLIRNVACEFNRRGKAVSVCGELAGKPGAALLLMGLGITKLSMNVSSVAAVKKLICSVRLEDAESLVSSVCQMSYAADVEDAVHRFLAANNKSKKED